MTAANERKARQTKFRKRTKSLFNKVRLLAKDTDASVALIVRGRDGRVLSFSSPDSIHWPPSSAVTEAGYDSTITVEPGDGSDEMDVSVLEDFEAAKSREAMDDTPTRPVSKPKEPDTGTLEVATTPVDTFAGRKSAIETPKALVDVTSNEIAESEEIREAATGELQDLGHDVNGESDNSKGLENGVSAGMPFNTSRLLSGITFNARSGVAVHGLGNAVGQSTGIDDEIAGMRITVCDFEMMDLEVGAAKNDVELHAAGIEAASLEAADTLCTISRHDPWHMVNLEGQSRRDTTTLMGEWGWVMTGRRR